MNNAELIKALRYCISDEYVEQGCLICPICVSRQGEMKCASQDDAIKYAADAIERLQTENDEIRSGKANQMTNIQTACVLLIHELYKTEPVGGDLHIVVDDCNVTNDDLAWCEHYIKEKHGVITKTVLLEFTILGLLALMTEPEREECVNKA